MVTLFSSAQSLYNQMLEVGVAKECARFVLPLATPTRMYMTGSLRSWMHYIALREKSGTQKEHMDIAKGCKKIFVEQFPTCAEALGGLDVDWVL
jgi:thymidylate synthase (FAD)